MPHVLRVFFIILEVVLLFNLLIVVHELGHFLAARWRGLYIEKFGIWFGKPLWKKTINGVQYSLGSIPCGGFVALPQLAPMDLIEGKADVDRARLPRISALDKIIVAFAGPLFSVLLALFFACIVWAAGHPVSESDLTTVIGYVEPDSPAAKAGLQAGDKIYEVDGRPVSRFSGMTNSIVWNVVRSEGALIHFKVERAGTVLDLGVVPRISETRRWWIRKSTRQVMILPAQTALVDKVEPNSPAAAADLKHGDIVVGFNGQRIYHPVALSQSIEAHPNEPITLQVNRGGAVSDVALQPRILNDEKIPRLGIHWEQNGRMFVSHPDPIEQVYHSITGTLQTIGAVASPKSDVKFQHMSGPITILRIYYLLLFESEDGWKLALWFSVLLNVNLAILNMLPIPVLDGGHILLAVIEGVRRKPVNMKILEWVQTACAALIIGYMFYISVFDIGDFFGKDSEPKSARKEAAASVEATPANAP